MPLLENIGYLATCKDKGAQEDIHPINNAVIDRQDNTVDRVGAEVNLPKKSDE